ncbi:MAG TPA: hypothetical protein VIL13_00965 [Longimicrobiales bacterium]
MAGLDFRAASDLFLGTEEELALALGVSAEQVRAWRKDPRRVSDEVLARLGKVLVERAKGMARVGELLLEGAGR